jgi:galactokinase
MQEKIKNKFRQLYGHDPYLFCAPGRINIIGEHTDYNEGFVLPAAIDKAMYFAVSPNNTGRHRIFALNLNRKAEFDTDKINIQTTDTWSNYLLGVIAQLKKKAINTPGLDVVFGGEIPTGAGLSSSAALTCGFMFAINSIYQLDLSNQEMAMAAQMAEHEYAGVKCGIMDQFAVLYGQAGHAIKLDCRSLGFVYIPAKAEEYSFILCNSGVKHKLAASEYNTRRKECEQGVNILSQYFEGIRTLRDASHDQLKKCADSLPGNIYKRCTYVIDENIRVLRACEAMEGNDIAELGKLMFATHGGLKDMYEVSCEELDQLVDIAGNCEGVAGARMMGGGFGGCTINLVKNDAVSRFINKVSDEYYKMKNTKSEIFKVAIGDGVKQV